MSIAWNEFISKCDEMLRAGRIADARAALNNIVLAKVPRSQLRPLAKMCRRAGLLEKGLRLLFPIVRNEEKILTPATAEETCEYAVLLSRIGSIPEALGLLNGIDPKSLPEVLLYRGFCHSSGWDYAEAAPLFEEFLRAGVDDYSKLIARVNLASSYLAVNRLREASDLLTETIALAKAASAGRLVGNCLELRGQVNVFENNFAAARADLQSAADVFGTAQTYDRILIQKWFSIMDSAESESTEALTKFRALAVENKHWESVREADLFSLKIDFDQRRFDHLVIGTSAPQYQMRIRQTIDRTPSAYYDLGDESSLSRMDLSLGEGKKIHQLLIALTRDFYVPRNLGSLFSALYPGEYFNVNSSPARLHQVVTRGRRWLAREKIPASILGDDGFRLSIGGSFALRVPLRPVSDNLMALRWTQLEMTLPHGRSFTGQEIIDALNISKASSLRLIMWAKSEGRVRGLGQGRSTRYQFLLPAGHARRIA